MRSFDIARKNIRKSRSDYSIYFFTLILGVTIFYMFKLCCCWFNCQYYMTAWMGEESGRESDQIQSDQSLSRVRLFATP